jgi:hypothetical protein
MLKHLVGMFCLCCLSLGFGSQWRGVRALLGCLLTTMVTEILEMSVCGNGMVDDYSWGILK